MKVKTRKGCVFFMLILALVLSGWLMLSIQQEEQARNMHYINILTQAPCIENICPGFKEDRVLVLERLSNSDVIKRASFQGNALIGFAFTSGKSEGGGGSGGIYFTSDLSSDPQMVRRISFRLHNLSLAIVLHTLGEPEKYLFISGCGMGRQVHAKLFYPSRGVEVIVNYVTRQAVSETLAGDTLVSSIEFFSPTDFQTHILESLDWYIMDTVAYDLDSSVSADDILAEIRPWPGMDASPTPSADFCSR